MTELCDGEHAIRFRPRPSPLLPLQQHTRVETTSLLPNRNLHNTW